MKGVKIFFIVVYLLLIGSTSSSYNQQEQRGFIYAIVFEKVCNGESAAVFVHKAVEKAGYPQKMKELKQQLQAKYPNAKPVNVGSSFFEYGTSAKYFRYKIYYYPWRLQEGFHHSKFWQDTG